MKHLQFTLTPEQTNQILEALSHRPYLQVYELIAHIQQSAQTQSQAQEAAAGNGNGMLAEDANVLEDTGRRMLNIQTWRIPATISGRYIGNC